MYRSGLTAVAALLTLALLAACSVLPGGATPNTSPSQPPLLIDANKLITWEIQPGELTGVMVVQVLKNTGQDWIQVAPRDSTYEIKAPNGNVVAANNFRHAYPTYLGPGDTGYLIDQYIEGDVPMANITNLTVNARFRAIAQKPNRLLKTNNTTLRSDELPGGLYVTGDAENVGDVEVANGHVGAVFFDAAGAIIGASTTDVLEHVLPGASAGFETRPSNPLAESAVADFVVNASATL